MAEAPIGIFGGTFDPIHFGHLRLAEEMAEQINLAQIRFIPAGTPPHRSMPRTDAAHRLAMVELATANNARFVVDTREMVSPSLSYTVDTLHSLRVSFGTTQPLCLLLGADAFLGLTNWNRWRELFDLSHIAIAHRPGYPQSTWKDNMPEALRDELEKRLAHPDDVKSCAAGLIVMRPITALDISATHIRDTLRGGRNPRYLLPDAVLDYIHTHQLYLPEAT
ncbi:nicotinate-nucleotide adenylyltransferase [Sulfuriferula nivalis]|uniref:Probable nicotinate-nucleotide adenylyltransferase n=1 Tax=Sulfuriferula nivalis TaxID=2675298 RepID=A0A809RSL4_9PROT|nr:nicotinate-nucleotide adenylyltransferase [Sulfuriferula nivalis]BBP01871.1 putative nicotinate-nucleotide adenylyltransferase [Sulfuriferula nivalis]